MLGTDERIGRYRVVAPLGAGGMGEVYRAHDDELGRDVALKLVKAGADETSLARFKREARAASAFQHPNAATVYDVGVHAGRPYIVMELVAGESLRSKLASKDVTDGDRVSWLVDVARALAAAHDAGLVHRDIKPDNVVVGRDGSAKVLDFGIARSAGGAALDPSTPTEQGPTLTAEGTSLGTPAYMSPEQIRGEKVDARSDQFSWGATAFELFTGQLPWATTSSAFAIAGSILHEPHRDFAALAPNAPPKIAAVIERALAKSPDDRFPSMRDVERALEAAVGAEVPPPPADVERAAPAGAPARTPPWGIVFGAGVIALGAYWLYGAIVTPIPPKPRPMGSAPRGDILGLDDSATRAREAALDAPAPRIVAGSAVPSSEIAAAPAFAEKCLPDEAKSRDCAKDNDAWCDPSSRRPIACCVRGLAATADGHCVCPPGGSTREDVVASGCTAAEPGYTASIQLTVRSNFDRLRGCYEAALARNPKLRGKLSARFTITVDGSVTNAELAGASVPDEAFQTCFVEEFGKLRFGAPPDGSVTVTYPIDFSPGGGAPQKK